MRIVSYLLVILFLSACQNAEGTAVDDNTEGTVVCKKEELQHLVGQPETVLETMKFGENANIRVLRADGFATQDYSETRTNIVIGTDGKISEITCG